MSSELPMSREREAHITNQHLSEEEIFLLHKLKARGIN